MGQFPSADLKSEFAGAAFHMACRNRVLVQPSRSTGGIRIDRRSRHVEARPEIRFKEPSLLLRTTIGVGRLDEEIKRRTRVAGITPNREACLRLATSLCAEQSDEWVTGKRYLDESRHWQHDHLPW